MCPRIVRAGLLATILASTLVVSINIGLAAERDSTAQIRKALEPAAKSGDAVTPQDAAKQAEEQRFIDDLRGGQTRSLTLTERQSVAAMAQQKPNVDLEIEFKYNSAIVSPRAYQPLTNLGRALRHPDFKETVFLVGGHTDAKGNDEYNLNLSQRRAAAVRRFLIERFHLPQQQLVAIGFGKEQPKNPQDPFAAENRRVQIVNMTAQQVGTNTGR